MVAVKGSKQYQLKVVKDRPYLRVLTLLMCFLVLVVVSGTTYKLGHDQGMNGQEKALADAAMYKNSLEASQADVAKLQQDIANIHLGSEVDKQANEDVRKEVIQLKEQFSELKEENSFYKNLMAPSGNKRGLTFGVVEIADTENLRNFRLKVVMQQLAVNHNVLKGHLKIIIIGKQGELEVKYNFSDLSKEVSASMIKLNFKYFQTIEGVLSLPEGFEPERIELYANTTGKKPVTIEKRFGWLVEKV